jgi:hypothetical protein
VSKELLPTGSLPYFLRRFAVAKSSFDFGFASAQEEGWKGRLLRQIILLVLLR